MDLQPLLITLAGTAITGLIAWLIRSWQEGAKATAKLQFQMDIVWKMLEPEAIRRLHHSMQPEMDRMLEGAAAGRLTLEEQRQYVQRLELIASGASDAPAQVAPAHILLPAARAQLEARQQGAGPLSAELQDAHRESDRVMAATTAAESALPKAESEPASPVQAVAAAATQAAEGAAIVAEAVAQAAREAAERQK